MEALSSNEAKTHFGDLLMKVQREPVQINRNGKPVAIVISMDDYLNFETLKMQQLKNRVEQAKEDIAAGRTVDGDMLFDHLLKDGSD
ncbi:MAG: type II toxin-antitoxin system Phd/YefM family antitoxin [Legionellaceae bacterium]|nr:type II toxin-antitoxin system Phd/YefM family antitoxin [Legionellaceae bacterium]